MGSVVSLLFGQSVTVSGERYTVVRRIGEGGFSYVYLVRRGGRKYALKRMLMQIHEQEVAAEKEIEAHGLVKHPNVMPLMAYDIRQKGCTTDREALLVFPFYAHGTVQDLIEKSSPLAENRIFDLFRSSCQAVQAFHDCTPAYAHRDVKPHNLLLSQDGREIVLMDLGSVAPARVEITSRQAALALQESAAQLCTAAYRAPELFEVPSECNIDERTDVWSLGCMLFAMAFGDSPFDGSALAAVSGRIRFPERHQYSENFCELIKWMLQPEPAQRPFIKDILQRLPSSAQANNHTHEV